VSDGGSIVLCFMVIRHFLTLLIVTLISVTTRLFLGSSLMGCSSSSSSPAPEAPAKELTQASSKSVALPEEEVLELGKRYYSLQLYSIAQEHFQSLKDSYPNSPYLEFAELKRADSLYEQSMFTEAASAYEDFTKAHPSSHSMPYAIVRIGRALQLSTRGAGRDVTPVEKSVEWFNKIIEGFPSSPFVVVAEKLRRDSLTTLADHEKLIGSFYEKKEALSAATLRETSATKTSFNAVALKGKVFIARVRRFPSVRGTMQSPLVVRVARRDKSFRKVPLVPVARDSFNSGENDDATTGTTTISAIQCSTQLGLKGSRAIFIYLSKSLDDTSFYSRYARMVFPRKVLSLTLPSVASRNRAYDCFGKGDLFVDTRGTLTLGNVKEAFLIPLESPSRLLVTIRDNSYTGERSMVR
jgi:outer membrane assembly lipoprotein YfiO